MVNITLINPEYFVKPPCLKIFILEKEAQPARLCHAGGKDMNKSSTLIGEGSPNSLKKRLIM
jgi:hypothetical protein